MKIYLWTKTVIKEISLIDKERLFIRRSYLWGQQLGVEEFNYRILIRLKILDQLLFCDRTTVIIDVYYNQINLISLCWWLKKELESISSRHIGIENQN